ncbi:MAG: hypothetical protein AAF533_29245 [Acidobacteriota bacterium]
MPRLPQSIDGARLDEHGVTFEALDDQPAVTMPWSELFLSPTVRGVSWSDGRRMHHRSTTAELHRALQLGLDRRSLEAVRRRGLIERPSQRPSWSRGLVPTAAGLIVLTALGLLLALGPDSPLSPGEPASSARTWLTGLLGAGLLGWLGIACLPLVEIWKIRKVDARAIRIDATGLSVQRENGSWNDLSPSRGDHVSPNDVRWGGRALRVDAFRESRLFERLLLGLAKEHGVALRPWGRMHGAALRQLVFWSPLAVLLAVLATREAGLPRLGIVLLGLAVTVTMLAAAAGLWTLARRERRGFEQRVEDGHELLVELGWFSSEPADSTPEPAAAYQENRDPRPSAD